MTIILPVKSFFYQIWINGRNGKINEQLETPLTSQPPPVVAEGIWSSRGSIYLHCIVLLKYS